MQLKSFLRQLSKLDKAYGKLLRAVPDPNTAENVADKALDAVLNSLSDPKFSAELDLLILDARNKILDNTQGFTLDIFNIKKSLIKQESKLASPFGLREKDMELLFKIYREWSGEVEKFVTNTDILRQYHIALHNEIKTELAFARELPKNEKKNRKRNIAQGIASAIFGTVVIAADTELPALFAFSYGLGGSAIHQAIRDIIGTEA